MIGKIQQFTLVVVLALGAAACGSDAESGGVSGQSAQELLRNAQTQLTQQPTVTISGSAADQGSTIKLNMTYAGKTAKGTITLDGARIRLLLAKGQSYIKGSDKFFRQAAGKNAAQFKSLVNGRWILIDKGSKDFEGLAGFVNRKAFLGGLAKQLKGNVSKGEAGRVSGIDCLSLEDDSGRLWVSKEDGTLVRLETNDGQALDFAYDRVRPARPPKPADVFDVASMG